MAWWEQAKHPPKLRDFAQDTCTRFGLPCRLSEELPAPSSFSSTSPHSSPDNTEDTDIEARNQDVAAESSGEVKVQQVSNEQSSCLFNPINELRVVPSSSDNSDRHQSQLGQAHGSGLKVISNDTDLIPRPKDQPLRSILSFPKPELLSFLDSPYNVWQTSALANFLPSACADLRMVMPWTGTPLPTLEIRMEVPIEFSEAFMKYRQSRVHHNEPPSPATIGTCHDNIQFVSVNVHSTDAAIYLDKKGTCRVPIHRI
ncbi:hypothetical protein KXX21_003954 [Aspergillus fumigatus]|nr:hypothetical protein KXX21_003954 [Aspergillus fumigatus]